MGVSYLDEVNLGELVSCRIGLSFQRKHQQWVILASGWLTPPILPGKSVSRRDWKAAELAEIFLPDPLLLPSQMTYEPWPV